MENIVITSMQKKEFNCVPWFPVSVDDGKAGVVLAVPFPIPLVASGSTLLGVDASVGFCLLIGRVVLLDSLES